MKPERARFMLYLRVLLKYLQHKDDQDTYETLKLALHDCATKSRRKEKGYESLTLATQRLIPAIVSQEDMAKARGYTRLLLRHMSRREEKGVF